MKQNIFVESVLFSTILLFLGKSLTKCKLFTIYIKWASSVPGGKFMIIVSPKELYKFLKDKGIDYLYFSTTVKNACSMIDYDTLMSLRVLSLNELPMSSVDNEDTYKRCHMWNKIPLYLCNLHGYFSRQNRNGPVCLKISVDFLLDIHDRDLYISKRNPLNWKKTLTKNDICYSSVEEFSECFDTLNSQRKIHKNIILIRDKKSQISLSNCLLYTSPSPRD